VYFYIKYMTIENYFSSQGLSLYYFIHDMIWYDMIYLLTAVGLTPGGSSTVHIYTKQYTEQHNGTEYTEQNIHNNNNTYT
jgi:hypothetical protein